MTSAIPSRPRSSLRGRVRGVYRAILSAAYRGDRVECPCCGGRFRSFLPFGVVRRENAMCPRCGSLERHRLLWLYLKRSTDVFLAPLRLLHVAPEALIGDRLAGLPQLRYVSIDLDSPRAHVRMDVTRLALGDHRFDAILCLHVLEHVEDDRAAMREFARVLAPGGWAILQSPVDALRAQTYEDPSITDPAQRERAFGQRDHVRIYGRDYVDRLREAGFRVEERAFVNELPAGDIARFGLDPEEALTLCYRD